MNSPLNRSTRLANETQIDFFNIHSIDHINVSITQIIILSGLMNELQNESSWFIGRSFFEFPNSFQKRREKPKKKLRKNGNFYAKPVFDQIDLINMIMVVIQKLITVNT
ncbi:Uncharacterized protein FWK35_00012990 [Aphis craccivora]|uniref:Uncharacterized protein n=1 Tax=Aphis craccivora TaxID=307492 RepID=A0A6G0YE97_APHCR|nr:Uncharacterized protein FWK35_00012990 [Aphis craccivora]